MHGAYIMSEYSTTIVTGRITTIICNYFQIIYGNLKLVSDYCIKMTLISDYSHNLRHEVELDKKDISICY